jgi:DnaJ-class molecular chaperone
MADLYSRLGVTKGANEAEIKKAYRKLAKELHPDRNKDNPKATERFSAVTEAYDILTDATKRGQYDRGEIDEQGNPRGPFGFGGGGGGGGFRQGPGGAHFEFGGDAGGFGDIFEGLFGGGRGRGPGGPGGGFGQQQQRQAPKGDDVAYRLAVALKDAVLLHPQRLTLRNGKTVDVKLPNGLEEGTKIRLAGQGEHGPGGAGDAIITVTIRPDRRFRREGDDVLVDLPVTLKEAVIGGKVKVPTAGGAVMLSIPAGSTSGKVLRLKGKGFHRKSGERGDQLVRLMIDLPADDAALRSFVENWADSDRHDPRADW